MRSALAFAATLSAAAACGRAEVVVSIEVEVDDPAGGGTIRRALSDVEVRLLPFDRDAVFDSIVAVHPKPEPEVPTALLAARADVRAARAEWARLRGVEGERHAAFARLDSVQRQTMRAGDSARTVRDAWRDEAFADVGSVFAAKTRASRLDAATDTTDASGIARANLRVRPGRYWVHARYELTDTELYWNVSVTVERGEPLHVKLTRTNAEERLRL